MNALLDPVVMIPAIRDQVQAVAVDIPLVKIVPDQELQDFESREVRSLACLLAGFGALAFGLATYFPACRAKRIDPMAVLRSG